MGVERWEGGREGAGGGGGRDGFFFSSRRRHTRLRRDWSSDVCSSDLTGNSVSLEEQSVEIARNAMQYQLVTTLYGKNLSLIKTALGNRN